MAKREIVTITCDGPCGGSNEIPTDYDATWVLSRSDRKYRYIDLCPSCSDSTVAWMWDKGATRMADNPVTSEVRAARKQTHLDRAEEIWPPQSGASVGMTVAPDSWTNVGPGIGEVSEPEVHVTYRDPEDDDTPGDDELDEVEQPEVDDEPEDLPAPQAIQQPISPPPYTYNPAGMTSINPVGYNNPPPNWWAGGTANG